MDEQEHRQPGLSEAGQRRKQAERDRLAQALRDNLAKRKDQSRARAAEKKPDLKDKG